MTGEERANGRVYRLAHSLSFSLYRGRYLAATLPHPKLIPTASRIRTVQTSFRQRVDSPSQDRLARTELASISGKIGGSDEQPRPGGRERVSELSRRVRERVRPSKNIARARADR